MAFFSFMSDTLLYMKKNIFKIGILFFAITSSVFAQKAEITSNTIIKLIAQIGDSIPKYWIVKQNSNTNDEIIIQSKEMSLKGNMTSNDPLDLVGFCEIFIKIVPRISPDSIKKIQLRNKELKDKLPPQVSKNNLQKWHSENETTLTLIDSEPTNFDKNYSYRIKFKHTPKNDSDIEDFNKIIEYLNRLFQKY